MTVATTSSRTTPAVGDGANKAWPFTFRCDNAADLKILHLDALDVENEVTTDFSVALNADQEASPGGTVTYPVTAAAIANTDYMVVLSDIGYDQTLDLVQGGSFSAENIEANFDRMAMQIKQLKELLDRALKIRVTDADGFNTEVPLPVADQHLAVSSGADQITMSAPQLDPGAYTISSFVGNNLLNVADAAAYKAAISAAGLGSNTFTGVQTMNSNLNVNGNATLAYVKVDTVIVFDEEYDNGTSTATKTINWTLGQKQTVELGGNTTFSFTDPGTNRSANLVLKLIQDATGSRVPVWPATVKWSGGVAPTFSTTPSAVDFVFFYHDGTDYHGSVLLDSQ